jgi:hypothetical protein
MKFYILMAALVVGVAAAISYAYDHWSVRRATRRQRQKLLAQLTAQPPVKADFSTPEGALLCLEDCYRRGDIEAAAACRDFVTEARLWLQDRGHLSRQKKEEMLPETIKAIEKSFRDGMAKGPPVDWIAGKTYFLPHKPFAPGIVMVRKYTQVPEGALFAQRILVSQTGDGWRMVKTMPTVMGDEA